MNLARSSASDAGARLRTVSGALLVLCLVACTPVPQAGQESQPVTPAGATQTGETAVASPSATATETATTLATPTASPAGSALQRRDTPPGGVSAQFEYFIEGIEPCGGLDESTPAIALDGSLAEVGTIYHLCLTGVAAEPAIIITIALPDGSGRAYTIEQPGEGLTIVSLPVVPGDPVGDYTATAAQGETQVSTTYSVARPTSPQVLAIPPQSGPPGQTFRFGLAGFAAGTQVGLDLYQNVQANSWVYLTSLPPAVTDGLGEAIYELTTSPGDPQSIYCLVYRIPTEPPHDRCDETFTVAP